MVRPTEPVPAGPARQRSTIGAASWTPAGTWITRSSVDTARGTWANASSAGSVAPPRMASSSRPGRSRSTLARVSTTTPGGDASAPEDARRRQSVALDGDERRGAVRQRPRPTTHRRAAVVTLMVSKRAARRSRYGVNN